MLLTAENDLTAARKSSSGAVIRCTHPVIVTKIGGSILANDGSYRNAARFLRDEVGPGRPEKRVVVVSAQYGATNTLEESARTIMADPDQRMLDLLWSTGELRSVAMLVMHLHALDISATGLNIHETGLRYRKMCGLPARVELASNRLRSALRRHQVVVVPGFLATTPAGSVISLGRGGSDLTAVLLAAELHAERCELIKDVPGYFTTDPHKDAARRIQSSTYTEALAMAEAGCVLVQRGALHFARDSKVPLVIRSMADPATHSRIFGR